MALDEYLFGKVARYFKDKRNAALAAQARTVCLAELKPRLTILACAASGQPIEIFPAEQEGGFKNNNFFLPASCALFPSREQNQAFYHFRVLYLCVQKKLRLNGPGEKELPVEAARKKALETSTRVLDALFDEYPPTRDWHRDFRHHLEAQTPPKRTPDYSMLYGKWMREAPNPNAANPVPPFTDPVKPAHEHGPQTTLKARAVEEIIQLQVDKKAQEDYVLTHNFEKVETADEFSGVWRDFDGDDELEQHSDALDELNMKFTVRVDDPAHSVYQSDFLENTSVSESADTSAQDHYLLYDEWDFSQRAYKFGYCKLYPRLLANSNAPYYDTTLSAYASTLTGLRKMLTTLNNKMMQQRRQTQGDAFDIDSVTDLYVDIRGGHTPSEKIYLSNRKKEKNLSVLLLLDVSLSSDSYAAGNRVIDVEKQVSILFGEILHEFNIDFSIDCFYSKTRNHATYITLKAFDEPWSKAKYRIGAIEPGGYTRIGTALRHSGALLDRRPTKNKWLILISDGKPNDFDRYEGRYGIQDIKQALRELSKRHINAYALAIEATAKHYLPQMFGQGNYQVLSSPVELLNALVHLYEKIRVQS